MEDLYFNVDIVPRLLDSEDYPALEVLFDKKPDFLEAWEQHVVAYMEKIHFKRVAQCQFCNFSGEWKEQDKLEAALSGLYEDEWVQDNIKGIGIFQSGAWKKVSLGEDGVQLERDERHDL